MQRAPAFLIGAFAVTASLVMFKNSGCAAEPVAQARQGAAEKTRVKFHQLGQDVEVIGALGHPLSKLLVVEGSLFQPKPDERIPKVYEFKTVFVAERVNGQRLQKPAHVYLEKAWQSIYEKLKPGQKLKLTGYEDGGFAFESEDVWAYRRKRGEGEAARMQRHFNVDFYVLEVEPVARPVKQSK